MFDIGIVVGKFAPLTVGHINLITQASLQAKKVIVVLSHDNRWLAKQSARDQKVLSFKNRLRWLQQHYADTDHVEIQYIIEDDIPEFPNQFPEDRTFVISSADYKERFDEAYSIINSYLFDVNKGNA